MRSVRDLADRLALLSLEAVLGPAVGPVAGQRQVIARHPTLLEDSALPSSTPAHRGKRPAPGPAATAIAPRLPRAGRSARRGRPAAVKPAQLSAYLKDAPDVFVWNRRKSISDVPKIGIANKPIDGGNYLFGPDEMEEFLADEPAARAYFRRWRRPRRGSMSHGSLTTGTCAAQCHPASAPPRGRSALVGEEETHEFCGGVWPSGVCIGTAC